MAQARIDNGSPRAHTPPDGRRPLPTLPPHAPARRAAAMPTDRGPTASSSSSSHVAGGDYNNRRDAAASPRSSVGNTSSGLSSPRDSARADTPPPPPRPQHPPRTPSLSPSPSPSQRSAGNSSSNNPRKRPADRAASIDTEEANRGRMANLSLRTPVASHPHQQQGGQRQQPGDHQSARDSICLCTPAPRIPRPRNAFILYRQFYQQQVVAQNPGLANPEISKIIGEQWREQPEEVKDRWKKLAEDEKERHLRQYPLYKYQPQRKNKAGGSQRFPTASADDPTRCQKCGGRFIATPKTPSTPFTPQTASVMASASSASGPAAPPSLSSPYRPRPAEVDHPDAYGDAYRRAWGMPPAGGDGQYPAHHPAAHHPAAHHPAAHHGYYPPPPPPPHYGGGPGAAGFHPAHHHPHAPPQQQYQQHQPVDDDYDGMSPKRRRFNSAALNEQRYQPAPGAGGALASPPHHHPAAQDHPHARRYSRASLSMPPQLAPAGGAPIPGPPIYAAGPPPPPPPPPRASSISYGPRSPTMAPPPPMLAHHKQQQQRHLRQHSLSYVDGRPSSSGGGVGGYRYAPYSGPQQQQQQQQQQQLRRPSTYHARTASNAAFDESLRLPPLLTEAAAGSQSPRAPPPPPSPPSPPGLARRPTLDDQRSTYLARQQQQQQQQPQQSQEQLMAQISFATKLRIMATICPPLRCGPAGGPLPPHALPSDGSDPPSPRRGPVIAIEGDYRHPALLRSAESAVAAAVDAAGDGWLARKWRVDAVVRDLDDERGGEEEGGAAGGGGEGGGGEPGAEVAAQAQGGVTDMYKAFMRTVLEWYDKSNEIARHVTSKPDAAAASASSETAGPEQKKTAAPATRLPVALATGGFGLTLCERAAAAIPIVDAYAPADHWQWVAAKWRGVTGPDLVVYVRPADDDDEVRARGTVEVAASASASAGRRGAAAHADMDPRLYHQLLQQRHQQPAFITVRVRGGRDALDETTERRLGFEVLEWMRAGNWAVC